MTARLGMAAVMAGLAMAVAAPEDAPAREPGWAVGEQLFVALEVNATYVDVYLDLTSARRRGERVIFDLLIVDRYYGHGLYPVDVRGRVSRLSATCGWRTQRSEGQFSPPPGDEGALVDWPAMPGPDAPGPGGAGLAWSADLGPGDTLNRWLAAQQAIARLCAGGPQGGEGQGGEIAAAAPAPGEASYQGVEAALAAERKLPRPQHDANADVAPPAPAAWMRGSLGRAPLALQKVAGGAGDGRVLFLDLSGAARVGPRVTTLRLQVLPVAARAHAWAAHTVFRLSRVTYDCAARTATQTATAGYGPRRTLLFADETRGEPRRADDSPQAAAEIAAACAPLKPGRTRTYPSLTAALDSVPFTPPPPDPDAVPSDPHPVPSPSSGA
ncbi:MAG: hypothetical protein JWP35_3069 [Caulobacter sp.]|nr:hypothetical protein [Caulobacter sp.]